MHENKLCLNFYTDVLNTKLNNLPVSGYSGTGYYIRFPGIKMQICFGTISARGSLTPHGSGFAVQITKEDMSGNTFAKPFALLRSVVITNNSDDWGTILYKSANASEIAAIVLGHFQARENNYFTLDYIAVGSY